MGQIVNNQGVRGEVRVISHTDFPEQRFLPGNQLTAFLPDGKQELLTIDNVRTHKGLVILHFKDRPSINDVEYLKKAMLKISGDQQVQDTELADGEYFLQQIIGLAVYDLDNHYLGKVTDIMQTGANDVWVVERDNGKEILVPKIDDVVKTVDLDHQKIMIDLLEGLE